VQRIVRSTTRAGGVATAAAPAATSDADRIPPPDRLDVIVERDARRGRIIRTG
jgi:hypothetical protein